MKETEQMGLSDMIFKVTVRIPKKEMKGLLGFAQVKINDTFIVDSIAIRESSKDGKPFISLPAYKSKDKDGREEWKQYFFPITKEAREVLFASIMEEYEREMSKES